MNAQFSLGRQICEDLDANSCATRNRQKQYLLISDGKSIRSMNIVKIWGPHHSLQIKLVVSRGRDIRGELPLDSIHLDILNSSQHCGILYQPSLDPSPVSKHHGTYYII
jgi:hypothetical protein